MDLLCQAFPVSQLMDLGEINPTPESKFVGFLVLHTKKMFQGMIIYGHQ